MNEYLLDKETIQKACQALTAGEAVGMPTETVYGLAADALNGQAVAKVYELKGRPSFNPLIIHVHSLDQALEYGEFNEKALALAKHFWAEDPCYLQENSLTNGAPNLINSTRSRPLTIIVPLKQPSKVSSLVTAGLKTIAIRRPNHPVALALLKAYGKPLAAPSANKSMCVSPTSMAAVLKFFPSLLVLDGGRCQVGLESTIIDLSTENPTILRHGGTTAEEISNFMERFGWQLSYNSVQTKTQPTESTPLLAPGMMKKHYSPKLPVKLNCTQPLPGNAFLGFGFNPSQLTKADIKQGTIIPPHMDLSKGKNMAEAAANLFYMLDALDNPKSFTGISVMPIPTHGLGTAINDRLKRAACANND